MLKNLKHFGYPYVAFFLVVGLLIGYRELVMIPHAEKNGTVLSATVSMYVDREEAAKNLVGDYQNDVRDITIQIDDLLDSLTLDVDSVNNKEKIDNLELEILNMKVPEIYREMHLKMLGFVNSLKRVNNGDFNLATLPQIRTDIESIKKQYAWF